ncbi:MAG: imidazole glycerol phosphate synthase subunit HisH [Bacteroidota bacterium]
MCKVAIIKYNAGNIQSVVYALERQGVIPTLTDDPQTLHKAERVIFPGVGEASSAMRYLKEKGLDQVIKELKQPVLGICLGLQLMCQHSEENDTVALGIFPASVKLFPQSVGKVPHMGWNNVATKQHPLLAGIPNGSHMYFVHGYYAELNDYTVGQTEYGLGFSSVMQRDNFFATQFHPEKSGRHGAQILQNFLNLAA